MKENIKNSTGKYYIYHIPTKKIGVTRNLNKRVTIAQGYKIGEYEVLESSEDIDYISRRESELQRFYGYKVDRDSYKKVINKSKKSNQMKLNVTDQTTTFPCPVNKLKGQLTDAIGLTFETPFGNYLLNKELISWIMSNVKVSMFNTNRCFIYNKALHEAVATNFNPIKHIEEALAPQTKETEQPTTYDLIRRWANNKGILTNGDPKTQYVKLMEESGELARAILKDNTHEFIDAIGDMVVVLTNLAAIKGLRIEDCVDSAYNEIKDRQGSMQNGTFVKEYKGVEISDMQPVLNVRSSSTNINSTGTYETELHGITYHNTL